MKSSQYGISASKSAHAHAKDGFPQPAFAQRNIPVVFSADEGYAPYLRVTLQSLIENAAPENNYDVFILCENLSPYARELIESVRRPNISVRFINVSSFLSAYDRSLFALTLHFTIATYYRFFIPEIFRHFDKIIYMDCDSVLLKDPARLYEQDVEGFYLAATRDLSVLLDSRLAKELMLYLKETLKLKKPDNYFQAGCLLMNLRLMRKDRLTKRLIAKLQEIKTPRFSDQCVLNVVCQGKVKFVEQNWNYTWHIPYYHPQYAQLMAPTPAAQYIRAEKDPWFVHYTGMGTKPWMMPHLPLAHYFWKYARQTPCYEDILYRNLPAHLSFVLPNTDNKAPSYPSMLARYYRCKVLSRLTWGSKRAHYCKKREALHDQVRQMRTRRKK